MPAPDGGDDFVGVGGPCEGLGVGIMLVEEAVDCGLEIDDGSEDAPLESPLGQFCEEPFDGVQPRARGRREVERPAGMRRQPFSDFQMLVSSVIVDNRVNHFAGGNLRLDGI